MLLKTKFCPLRLRKNHFVMMVFGFVIFLSQNSFATTCTAIANGNWGAASSWSCGRAPMSNDTVVVPFGKKITVNINSPVYANVVLKVFGILFFNNGQKLNFNCGSIVVIYASGLLDGGNPGSKIDMCGTTVWRGPGPDSGPLTYGFNPLPINLYSFSASTCEPNVCLSWTTISETNNDFFTVEKTVDDVNYALVARVRGAGNSTGILNYSFVDTEPYSGVSYYRLSQTDFNGSTSIFTLREVDRNPDFDFSLNLFPNPGYRGTINISVKSKPEKEVLVVVYDIMGREAFSKIIVTSQNGATVVGLDPSGKLEKGVYRVCGSSDNKFDSKMLIVN